MKEIVSETFSVWREHKIHQTANLLSKVENADRTLNTSRDPIVTISAFIAYLLYETLYEVSRYDLWLFNAISKTIAK